MAKFEFRLPDIGEGVTEGEIVSWLVEPGATVAENQDMVEVMTDKATVTISSPKAGTVAELKGKMGDVVPVGGVLIVLELGDSEAQAGPSSVVSSPAAEPAIAGKDDGPAASAVGDIKSELPGTSLYSSGPSPAKIDGAYYADKPLASPAVRKMARELGLDLRRIKPSGKSGQVTREDIEQQKVQSADSQPSAAPVGMSAPAPSAKPLPAVSTQTRTPIRGLRKRIYENMARSKRTAAHFTYVDECDVTELELVKRRTAVLAKEQGLKLTYLPFIVKAVVGALKKHAAINCLVDDAAQEIVQCNSYDIGIAMATEAGLIVPVLRDADKLSILGISREIDRLASAARAAKTRPEDLGGSSFTITSLGKQGGLFATPVINYPEVAILGVHQIKKRPVVRNDQIEIGQVMLLSLSFDHRLIDGNVGADFAQEVISYLQTPDRLLIDG